MEWTTVNTQHVPVRVLQGGEGPPLLFLHGAGGVRDDDLLLKVLSRSFSVHAPLLPGYGDSRECSELRDMLDFTLHHWDVVDRLGLKNPLIVGHSMGGMIAAEMAAIQPNDVSRLALIAPAGLWLDEHPIADIFATLPFEMPALLFHDAAAGAAAMTAGLDLDDPKFLQTYLVANARQLGMAGRILFPIPERGLSQRLYRIKAKTVLVWGESDKLIPPVYAREFQAGIAGASLVTIREAGHMAIHEKPTEVAAAITTLG